MDQISDFGADADAEMTVLCGMSFVFLWVLTTGPTSFLVVVDVCCHWIDDRANGCVLNYISNFFS